MKYLFLFLLVSLISCGGNDASSNASENVKPKLEEYTMDEVTIPYDTMAFFKYDMQPVTGIIIEKFSNDSIKFIGTFLEGRPNGIHRYWYNTSAKISSSQYKGVGEYEKYTGAGDPPQSSSSRYKGLSKSLLERLEAEIAAEEGTAPSTENLDKKRRKSEAIWKNGKLHGECRNWYKNGQLKSQINYIDGQIDGVYKSWYSNGKKWHEGNYLNGKEYGLQRYWYEDGQLQSEHTARNGVPYETRKDWHKDGKLAIYANYKNGKENRIMKTWDANGTLRWEASYKNDTILNESCWNKDGNEIECPISGK